MLTPASIINVEFSKYPPRWEEDTQGLEYRNKKQFSRLYTKHNINVAATKALWSTYKACPLSNNLKMMYHVACPLSNNLERKDVYCLACACWIVKY